MFSPLSFELLPDKLSSVFEEHDGGDFGIKIEALWIKGLKNVLRRFKWRKC
jgi:hypothetical protein